MRTSESFHRQNQHTKAGNVEKLNEKPLTIRGLTATGFLFSFYPI